MPRAVARSSKTTFGRAANSIVILPSGCTIAGHRSFRTKDERPPLVSSSDTAFWLSELTHPYWHLTERGVEVDISGPKGGKVVWYRIAIPILIQNSTEPDDLVSKGFLLDKALVAILDATLRLRDVNLDLYDAVHVAGGRGATFDLYPNDDVACALEHFWGARQKVGAICHGAIALGNVPIGFAAAG